MMKTVITVSLLATIALIATSHGSSNTIGWQDCSNDNAKFQTLTVSVSGCAQTPCTFKKGQTYTAEVSTLCLEDTPSTNYTVTGFWNGFSSVRDQGDTCDLVVNGTCPYEAGETYHSVNSYTVANLPIWGTVTMETTTSDGTCFSIEGILQ